MAYVASWVPAEIILLYPSDWHHITYQVAGAYCQTELKIGDVGLHLDGRAEHAALRLVVFPVINMLRQGKHQKYTDDTHLTHHREHSQMDKYLDCILQWMDLSQSKCKNLVNQDNSVNEGKMFVLSFD